VPVRVPLRRIPDACSVGGESDTIAATAAEKTSYH
jgi:hypothetical protein